MKKTESKVVPLRVVEQDEAATEELRKEHEELIQNLMQDGPFEFVLGVARKKDGTFVNFSTGMDIRDYVFAIELLKMKSLIAIENSFDIDG